MCTRMKFNFKCQQCGKEKEKPSTTMHLKLGISLPNFFTLKFCMETTLENFTRKTCYDYFQAYDIILICSLFVRILYFNYMHYYKKNVHET
jgi:hypothetical protein